MEAILVLIATFVVFYFLLIRPQQKRSKQHQELLKAVEPGDEVVTIGGLYGDVVEIDDQSVLIEVYDGTQMRFMRSAISRKSEEEAPVPAVGDDELHDDELQDDGQEALAESAGSELDDEVEESSDDEVWDDQADQADNDEDDHDEDDSEPESSDAGSGTVAGDDSDEDRG